MVRTAQVSTLACTVLLPMVMLGRYELALAAFALLETARLAGGRARRRSAPVPVPVSAEQG